MGVDALNTLSNAVDAAEVTYGLRAIREDGDLLSRQTVARVDGGTRSD
jgi:hypothetical protein